MSGESEDWSKERRTVKRNPIIEKKWERVKKIIKSWKVDNVN